jgi:iron-sulfur cluster assembly accessory protein
MIQLTASAASALQSAISTATNPVKGLRIAVEAGGCSGHKYLMGLVAEGKPEDLQVESNGVQVFVDPSSATLLNGTTIDFVVGLDGSGFAFRNPQAQSSCSCGKSFS